MQCKCSKCGKDFNDKVGMSPLQSNLAIRVRNRVGNNCKDCQNEICMTKRGSWRLFFWNLKVSFYCVLFLSFFAVPFLALIVFLALFVL